MFGRFVIVLLLVALAVGLYAHGSQSAGPERHYVVRPADTLWSIAARTYAGDTREGVWRLEQRNRLTSDVLTPGQVLVLPAG
jgi:nucleoid-associated protein YgaU